MRATAVGGGSRNGGTPVSQTRPCHRRSRPRSDEERPGVAQAASSLASASQARSSPWRASRAGSCRSRGGAPGGSISALDPRGMAGHDLNAVAEPQRLERIVGHQQHGAPGEQRRGQRLQAGAGDRIERRERLVHQDHRAILHERAGERGALALAARERRRQLVRLPLQADPREQVPGLGAIGGLAAQPGAERDVAPDREPRQQVVLLAHPGEPSGERSAVAAAPPCPDPAARGRRSAATGCSCRPRSGRAGRSRSRPAGRNRGRGTGTRRHSARMRF